MISFPGLPLSRRGCCGRRPTALQVTILAVMPALLSVSSGKSEARGNPNWYTAWAASHGQRFETPALSGNSVRMIVRPTISGTAVRLQLENTLGKEPVTFAAVYFGKQESGAAIIPGSNQRLT